MCWFCPWMPWFPFAMAEVTAPIRAVPGFGSWVFADGWTDKLWGFSTIETKEGNLKSIWSKCRFVATLALLFSSDTAFQFLNFCGTLSLTWQVCQQKAICFPVHGFEAMNPVVNKLCTGDAEMKYRCIEAIWSSGPHGAFTLLLVMSLDSRSSRSDSRC